MLKEKYKILEEALHKKEDELVEKTFQDSLTFHNL